mmetsp:Transcript_20902/g.55352  ORF Transcript_20902/g.55352 Transcript_20902/m.55352 type:complete len:251 (+) Transcript_20902:1740-2492(+)
MGADVVEDVCQFPCLLLLALLLRDALRKEEEKVEDALFVEMLDVHQLQVLPHGGEARVARAGVRHGDEVPQEREDAVEDLLAVGPRSRALLLLLHVLHKHAHEDDEDILLREGLLVVLQVLEVAELVHRVLAAGRQLDQHLQDGARYLRILAVRREERHEVVGEDLPLAELQAHGAPGLGLLEALAQGVLEVAQAADALVLVHDVLRLVPNLVPISEAGNCFIELGFDQLIHASGGPRPMGRLAYLSTVP